MPKLIENVSPLSKKKILKRIVRFINLHYINQAPVIACYKEFSSHITADISFLFRRLF